MFFFIQCNYTPNNCRWITVKESNRNKNNVKLTMHLAQIIRQKYATKKYTYKKLAFEYNVSLQTIYNIIKKYSWN